MWVNIKNDIFLRIMSHSTLLVISYYIWLSLLLYKLIAQKMMRILHNHIKNRSTFSDIYSDIIISDYFGALHTNKRWNNKATYTNLLRCHMALPQGTNKVKTSAKKSKKKVLLKGSTVTQCKNFRPSSKS